VVADLTRYQEADTDRLTIGSKSRLTVGATLTWGGSRRVARAGKARKGIPPNGGSRKPYGTWCAAVAEMTDRPIPQIADAHLP